MKVTQVAIRPTEASLQAGRPSLTPELLAASGARYSRNNEGLEGILSKIDPDNLDKSVDSIFRMIDYGHQSIADMAPVAMFIDGVTIWLAYYVWSLCPTAGGQESSTRYIKLGPGGLASPEDLGIPEEHIGRWQTMMDESFTAYEQSWKLWEGIAEHSPEVMRIPGALLDDPSDKAQRQVARMRRNYGFDRARYFLPVAALTNMMLIMSARGWVQLCQYLLAHPLPEAQRLGTAIRSELELSAPRMIKHAVAKDSFVHGAASEFRNLVAIARRSRERSTDDPHAPFDCDPIAFLDAILPDGISADDLADDLSFHDNRYSWLGTSLKRTLVRFGWDGVAFADIRDLNRHRTGTKHCPLVPKGFYYAADDLPSASARAQASAGSLRSIAAIGNRASRQALAYLAESDPSYVYWSLLGTQYTFEHGTTADKFIYEAELRTGTGAHFRYAKHLHDVLSLWYEKFPRTRPGILEGTAEPE